MRLLNPVDISYCSTEQKDTASYLIEEFEGPDGGISSSQPSLLRHREGGWSVRHKGWVERVNQRGKVLTTCDERVGVGVKEWDRGY